MLFLLLFDDDPRRDAAQDQLPIFDFADDLRGREQACARCGRFRANSRVNTATATISAVTCHVWAQAARANSSPVGIISLLLEPVEQFSQLAKLALPDAALLDQMPHQR